MPLRAISPRLTKLAAALAVAAAALLLGRSLPARASATPGEPSSLDLYTSRVQPIFQANCYRCHAGLNHRGGLQMDSQAALMKGGHDGVVILPGHPEQSLLVKLIRHEGPAGDPMPMPPKSKLSDADISAVETWIRSGAAMPATPVDR